MISSNIERNKNKKVFVAMPILNHTVQGEVSPKISNFGADPEALGYDR